MAANGIFYCKVFILMVLSQIGVLHGYHGPASHLNRSKGITFFGSTRLGFIQCGLMLVCFSGLSEIKFAKLRFQVYNGGLRYANLLSGGTRLL